MNRFKRGLAILLSTCMIGGMIPLPASAEETVSENIVQTECIEKTENLENAPSEDEKSSETVHETGSETESETVTDAETEGTAISAIQALIDALPDADSITEDNVENVTSQLDTIDEAKAELSDADMLQLDLTRYDAASDKVMVFMGMKEENDSEIAVQANDSAGKTEQQSTEEEECKHEGVEITFNSNGFGNCPKCNAIVYQPAVETTDKYDIDDDGEKETVYEISNAGQLYWFAGLVNGTLDGVKQNKLANAILTANITVNENLLDSLQYDTEGNVSNGSDFITWTPIADWMGNRTTQYSGTFDGNNKTVSGLYFNGDSTCIGLFGSSESDGNIKNVGVVDSYFKGNDHVGGVCGNNAGTITNCYNAGNLTAIESSATIGGICGYNNGGTVANCYNTGTVTATGSVASVGGVCGCSTELISNCYNIGTVTAASSDADISGICGYNFGPVKNCYYLADTEDENGGKTTAQFVSGEVAYLLSQGCTVGEGEDAVTYSGSVWGQALGGNGDTYPVLDSTKRVYQVDKYDGCEGKPGSSTKVYSNQSTSIYEEHKYEADTTDSTKHKCSICNGTEEHSFAYELVENGNAIKATCSECGATYTVKLTQPAATSDEKIVYDGTEKKAGTAIDSGNTGIETISENAITYAGVTNGTLSTYSTTAPKNAGTYKAKLTLGTGDNRVSIEINFTIEKAASPTIAGEEKSYAYSVGSDGKTIGVDIAGKLPTDRGTTTYAVAKTDTEQLLSEVAVDTAGNLTYKVNQVDSTKVGKTAIITVTASMENYENAEYTLTISSITDKKTVEIKSGNTVSVDGSNALTYGEKVSKLTLGNTVFVEAGTDDVIEGILSWSNPDEIPAAGTTQAGWVFKPADSTHYAELTGTAAITVAKATPIVVTVPTVAERGYNPDAALTGSDITGGSVTGADGNSLAGTWSFTGTNIIPTVNNKGYQAVFTPDDTNNYNTVTRTITVTVNKAAKAPNMPEAAMTPAHSTKKVGNITLQEGWSWQEADKDTVLADGVAVTATAVYIGADKGNYETESVSITITRRECDHTHTEIRNQREATCTQTGYAGDTYCTDCDKLMSTGKELAALGHDYKATVTKQPTTTEEGVRTYTCTRCSSSYTESIAKLTSPSPQPTATPSGKPETPSPQPKGTNLKDDTGAAYKVTSANGKTPAVQYLAPKSGTKGTVTVPSEVTIDGVTYKVTSIAGNAFKGTKKIKKIVIGSNITSIGKNAFAGCTSLTSITIGKNVTKIGKNAFTGCKKLKSITIKTKKLTTKTVKKGAFNGISKKVVVKVPKSKYKTYKKLLPAKGLKKAAKIRK